MYNLQEVKWYSNQFIDMLYQVILNQLSKDEQAIYNQYLEEFKQTNSALLNLGNSTNRDKLFFKHKKSLCSTLFLIVEKYIWNNKVETLIQKLNQAEEFIYTVLFKDRAKSAKSFDFLVSLFEKAIFKLYPNDEGNLLNLKTNCSSLTSKIQIDYLFHLIEHLNEKTFKEKSDAFIKRTKAPFLALNENPDAKSIKLDAKKDKSKIMLHNLLSKEDLKNSICTNIELITYLLLNYFIECGVFQPHDASKIASLIKSSTTYEEKTTTITNKILKLVQTFIVRHEDLYYVDFTYVFFQIAHSTFGDRNNFLLCWRDELDNDIERSEQRKEYFILNQPLTVDKLRTFFLCFFKLQQFFTFLTDVFSYVNIKNEFQPFTQYISYLKKIITEKTSIINRIAQIVNNKLLYATMFDRSIWLFNMSDHDDTAFGEYTSNTITHILNEQHDHNIGKFVLGTTNVLTSILISILKVNSFVREDHSKEETQKQEKKLDLYQIELLSLQAQLKAVLSSDPENSIQSSITDLENLIELIESPESRSHCEIHVALLFFLKFDQMTLKNISSTLKTFDEESGNALKKIKLLKTMFKENEKEEIEETTQELNREFKQ